MKCKFMSKSKIKRIFLWFVLKKIEKPSWGMMTHPRSWASFLIYTEIIQKLAYLLSDLDQSSNSKSLNKHVTLEVVTQPMQMHENERADFSVISVIPN